MGKENSDKDQFGEQAVCLEPNGKFTQLKWQTTAVLRCKTAGQAANRGVGSGWTCCLSADHGTKS
jgi:hypothetical protein